MKSENQPGERLPLYDSQKGPSIKEEKLQGGVVVFMFVNCLMESSLCESIVKAVNWSQQALSQRLLDQSMFGPDNRHENASNQLPESLLVALAMPIV